MPAQPLTRLGLPLDLIVDLAIIVFNTIIVEDCTVIVVLIRIVNSARLVVLEWSGKPWQG